MCQPKKPAQSVVTLRRILEGLTYGGMLLSVPAVVWVLANHAPSEVDDRVGHERPASAQPLEVDTYLFWHSGYGPAIRAGMTSITTRRQPSRGKDGRILIEQDGGDSPLNSWAKTDRFSVGGEFIP
jgi:hypothetical protein